MIKKDKSFYASEEIVYIKEKISDITNDKQYITKIQSDLNQGKVVIFKNYASIDEIQNIKRYMSNIKNNTLPKYCPVEYKCHDNFSINFSHPKSTVPSFGYTFNFFPWNQNIFSFFERFKPIYHLRNLISGIKKNSFIDQPDHECTANIGVCLFPKGNGFLHTHTDPYDVHQTCVPIMPMSLYGTDFKSGGNFIHISKEKKLYADQISDPGDIVLFHSLIPHGVELIDPEETFDPFSDEGRWTILFAVNRFVTNKKISESKKIP